PGSGCAARQIGFDPPDTLIIVEPAIEGAPHRFEITEQLGYEGKERQWRVALDEQGSSTPRDAKTASTAPLTPLFRTRNWC
ncbi:MAG: hypothetical protein ACREFK_20020, partial [Stellaceae bacterium]